LPSSPARPGQAWKIDTPQGAAWLIVVDREQVEEEGWEFTVIPAGMRPVRFIRDMLHASADEWVKKSDEST
jgi:hypothetical protein